jgi:hypothetical protein
MSRKSPKKVRKQSRLRRLLSRGGSDIEFLVLLAILVCVGLIAGVGYIGSNTGIAKSLQNNAQSVKPTLPPSNETVTFTLSVQRGVNWRPEEKWALEKDLNWRGIKSDLQDMQNANITWVRFPQSQKTKINDQLIELANEYKIRPVLIIWGNPTKEKGLFYQRMFYRNAVEKLAERYKGKVQYYEVGTEPNNPLYWEIDTTEGSDETQYEKSVSAYIERLKDTYLSIKKKDPKASILLGGLSPVGVERWLDVFMNLGGHQYVDIVSYHPYGASPDKVVDAVDTIKRKLAEVPELGVKPLWITEIGYTTNKRDETDFHVTDERTKADYLTEMYRGIRNKAIYGPIFWYTFVENDENIPGYGLIMKNNTTTKATYLPAYESMKNLQ